MKKLKTLVLLGFLFIGVTVASACEITMKVVENEQETYKVGDELVVEVHLQFTHRNCHVSVKDTKFQYQGVQILGATDWKRVSDMEYTRKLKVKVIAVDANKKGKTQIVAVRSCEKEGGMGSIEIKRS